MSDVPLPTHTFDVDLTNPGQFFACCGLLELANCLDPKAVGWFEGGQFHLHQSDINGGLVARFLSCAAVPASTVASGNDDYDDDEDESTEKSPPLLLGEPFNLRLDWWTDRAAVRAGFKTWGGGQTVLGVFDGMRRHVAAQALPMLDLLTYASPVAGAKPFSFDSRLSVLTLIDLGFFPDKSDPTFSAAVEALTLVGLQRFRPATIELRELYAYSTWREQLPASIAAAVTHGLVPALARITYQFPFVVRTGGKYKAFGPALPVSRSDAHG